MIGYMEFYLKADTGHCFYYDCDFSIAPTDEFFNALTRAAKCLLEHEYNISISSIWFITKEEYFQVAKFEGEEHVISGNLTKKKLLEKLRSEGIEI